MLDGCGTMDAVISAGDLSCEDTFSGPNTRAHPQFAWPRYHTSLIIDDQPWPINVRGGQKFIYVPYTGQTNDAGMLAWNREADYFLQMIKDQFRSEERRVGK